MYFQERYIFILFESLYLKLEKIVIMFMFYVNNVVVMFFVFF